MNITNLATMEIIFHTYLYSAARALSLLALLYDKLKPTSSAGVFQANKL